MRLDLKMVVIVGVVGLALLACDKRLDVFSDSGVGDLGGADGQSADLAQPDQRADGAQPDQNVDPTKPLETAWVKVLGDATTATFMPDGIEVDGEGNVYVEGWLAGRIQVGSEVLGADEQDSQVLIKLDATGKLLWGRHVGPVDMRGPGTATWPPDNLGLALDPASGSSYLVGTFSGTARAGTTTLTSAGGKDIYVAKLDKQGKWLWATSAGGPEDEYAHDAANGFIGPVVVGDFAGTASFGQVQLSSRGGTDIFIAHLDKSGTWAKALRAGSSETGPTGGLRSVETALAVGSRDGGRMFISGSQLTGASFGSNTLASGRFVAQATIQGTPTAPSWDWSVATPGVWWDLVADASSATFHAAGSVWSPSPGRPAVAALEADSGKVLWSFNAYQSSRHSEALGLTLDPGGGVYVAGYFNGTLALTEDGTHTLTTPVDANNGFVLKLDGKGQLLWVKPTLSTKGSYPQALCTGPDGALYVAGSFAGNQGPTFDGEVPTGQAANVNGYVWKLAPR